MIDLSLQDRIFLKEVTLYTEESLRKKMAASTPIGAKSSSANIIEIIDCDEPNITQKNTIPDTQGSGNISLSTFSAAEKGENSNANYAQNNEVNMDFGEDALFVVTSNRKHTCNVVLSESDRDDDDDDKDNDMHTQDVSVDKLVTDDDMPISKRTRMRKVTRRRLRPLRNCESKSQDDKKSSCKPSKVKLQQSIPTTNVDADDESEKDSSYSEEGNMSDFIVDDSDVSNSGASNSEDTSNNSQDGSNGEVNSDSSNSQDLEDNSKVSYSQDVSVSDRDMDFGQKGKNSDTNCTQNEEKLDIGEDVIFSKAYKRKRTRNVVLSESENDDGDDDVPISKLMHIHKVSDDMPISRLLMTKRVPRHRQHPPRKCVGENQDDKNSSYTQHKVKDKQTFPTNVDVADDDEIEEDLSYSEEGNLSGFIDDSDEPNCKDTSSKSQDECNGFADADSSNSQDLEDGDNDSDSHDVSDGEIDYHKILSKIQRKKIHKMKWDFEADMLADFGKYPELCMKAVCALNREQTYKVEMWNKEGFCPYKCGFSKYDVGRGRILAEFLTDGDPQGVLKKTVQELEEYDPNGVEVCRTLATRYSRQLYEIYQNKKDRIFP